MAPAPANQWLFELPTYKLLPPPNKGVSKMSNTNGTTEQKAVPVAFGGDRIVLPEGMDYKEARECLTRQEMEENTLVNITEKIMAFPFDGAVAFMKALKEKYGWANLEPTKTFFGDRPPSMMGVETGFNERIQVPWGDCTVPKIDGTLTTSWDFDEGMPIFVLRGTVKRKHEKEMAALASRVREIVKENSIYRGKAIKMNFRDSDGDRKEFNLKMSPRFIDLNKIGREEPIFSKDIEDALDVYLYTPITQTRACQEEAVPLKSGVILGGPYGTGKTLTAYKLADICVQHGWTFFYLEDVRDLDMAVNFAKLYEPCVLFAEDVDRATSGPRDPALDRILNTIDGIESKNRQITVVLTTNHLEWIHRAFLRPGRTDTVILFSAPDADAVCRIVRKYGCNKNGESIIDANDNEIKEAMKPLVGANASFIRVAVEKAKLAAIRNGNKPLRIKPQDLELVSKSMVPHVKLVNPEHGKGLFDDAEQIDPMHMAMSIITHKLAEAFVEQIANPKVLTKIVVKSMKKSGGGNPGLN